MDLIERIKDNFNKGYFNKAMAIDELPEEYPAWTIKKDKWVGVAVPLDSPMSFSEHFTNARMWVSEGVTINGATYDLLMLTSDDMTLRNEFATICSQFVQPGPDGADRRTLVSHPEIWWEHWKFLLGNRNSTDEVYSTLGELVILEKLLRNGEKAKWTGPSGAVHDIEMPDRSVEVKSTIARYGYEVTISSVYQMKKAGENLDLAFCRFERSGLGFSINEIAERIISLGYSATELEHSLEKNGFEKGCTARNDKYKLLELIFYPVDENFPAITEASFVTGKIPDHVIKYTYTIDLSGLPSKNIL